MSMTDHAPAVVHDFQTCTDAACGEALCGHYRAGLAAGSEFIRGAARGLARVRASAQEGDGELLQP